MLWKSTLHFELSFGWDKRRASAKALSVGAQGLYPQPALPDFEHPQREKQFYGLMPRLLRSIITRFSGTNLNYRELYRK